MKKLAGMCLLVMAAGANASPIEKSCLVATCSPGERGVTYATKTEPFLACPTRELAKYTSAVLGLISMQVAITGTVPNISDKTGEPEFLDQGSKPNETRVMLDVLRTQAAVRTFDQAVAMCAKGRNHAKVTIMNVQKQDEVVYVHDEGQKINYWMPSSSIEKR